MSKLRIFLADDHKVMREGLKGLLNAQPDMEVIGEADDGNNVWRKCKEFQSDVVLMDVTMPNVDGIKATEKMKRDCPDVKVLALSAHEDRSYVNQMLQAGASGYVLKMAAAEELVNAIRTVAAGGVYLDPTLASKVVKSYIRKENSRSKAYGNSLTEREEEVLRLIAEGYVNKEIAAQLGISVKTVEAHKANLMQKLNLKSRAEIVRYALDKGWLQNR